MFTARTERERGYVEGVRQAAAYIAEFDTYVAHPYRLSDCLLMKFNLLPKRRVRKNRGKKT